MRCMRRHQTTLLEAGVAIAGTKHNVIEYGNIEEIAGRHE